MAETVELRRITTKVPSRLDRLPWARWHWLVVVGLGTVWILDGLEVTIVGSIAAIWQEPGSGLSLTAGQVGLAGAVYVAGACIGALFFGQLTDRFGRKRLFMITLVLYLVATVLSAFSMNALYLYVMRFFTGAGIGGEYAAINSAIDELIPAKYRGRVDLAINGSFWVGATVGAVLSIPLLDTSLFPVDVGWRLAFGLGAILGLGILLVRRYVPESPRWLFIHGRDKEAEEIVDDIERQVRESTGRDLPEPRASITIRQRKTINFRQIAHTVFTLYPKRSVLCLALFVGQAFLYNAYFFTYATVITTFPFVQVEAADVGWYIGAFAISNFLGALLLGPLFDTVGRVTMISGTYILSALLLTVTAFLFNAQALTAITLTGMGMLTFFFASAGASAAYLTVSEIFPMETRALCIAFFYAIGTAAGGIVGPLLFGKLAETADPSKMMIGYLIGAALMLVGGLFELVLGVRAEQQTLENIAKPLTAEDTPAEGPGGPQTEHAPA
ncbi:MAG: MFS transporter [Actinomycetota bacterium]|nr:MFS transporter [Actinomycetota bacterium]